MRKKYNRYQKLLLSNIFYQMEDRFRSTLEVPREVQNSKQVRETTSPNGQDKCPEEKIKNLLASCT